MKRLVAIIGITVLAATAAGAQYYDYVDIGDLASETGYNLQDWGPVCPEEATAGGYYGGIAPGRCRPIWAGEPRWASLELDFGQTGAVMLSIQRTLSGPRAMKYRCSAQNSMKLPSWPGARPP